MERWTLKPAPTDADDRRHVLHFQGEMKDFLLILKRFGAICGRPDRGAAEPGYNFKVFLNKPGPEVLENLSSFLTELVPAPPAALEPEAATLPEISVRSEPADGETPPPALEPDSAQPPPLEPPSLEQPPLEPPPLEPPPEPAPPPIEQLPLAETTSENVPPMEPLPPQPPVEQLPLTEEPTAPAEPAPAAAPEPAPMVQAQAAPRAERAFWGLERKLDEKRDFDALLVGSYNRFAHAAATSVVGSPGTMYNPLFIHGGPGVGKTHMLNAIGSGLGKAVSPENILLTSGTRLSSAAAQASAAGRLPEILGLAERKKCLLIDDIHLITATEATQAALAKVFAHFLGQNLQVVITSLYPPKALGALEEALKISFARGSAVEMKVPGVEPQRDMVMASFSRHGTDLNNDENNMFHDKLGGNFFESLRWVRRLLCLKQLREAVKKDVQMSDLIAELFTPVTTTPGSDMPTAEDLEKLKAFSLPAQEASARALAVLFPKGSDALSNWMIYRFYDSASAVGTSQGYRYVLVDSYDPEQPFGVPFQIGEMCRGAGAEAALILGPGPQSKLSERTAEFAHAVKHILSDQEVAMGWVPYAATTSPVPFLHAHLDFLAQWSLPLCE